MAPPHCRRSRCREVAVPLVDSSMAVHYRDMAKIALRSRKPRVLRQFRCVQGGLQQASGEKGAVRRILLASSASRVPLKVYSCRLHAPVKASSLSLVV